MLGQSAERFLENASVWNKVQLYSHANITIRVVELHLCARLDPAHRPRLVPRHGRHDDPGRSPEVRGFVPQHDGRVFLDDRRALVNGGRDVVDNDVLAPDPRLSGDALDATHGPGYKERQVFCSSIFPL